MCRKDSPDKTPNKTRNLCLKSLHCIHKCHLLCIGHCYCMLCRPYNLTTDEKVERRIGDEKWRTKNKDEGFIRRTNVHMQAG